MRVSLYVLSDYGSLQEWENIGSCGQQMDGNVYCGWMPYLLQDADTRELLFDLTQHPCSLYCTPKMKRHGQPHAARP